MANTSFGNSNTIPGNSNVNTMSQLYPALNTPHSNTIGSSGDLGNGVMTAPSNYGQLTLAQMLENIRLINETFEASLSMRGELGFRALFDKDTIPQHSGTFSRTYIKAQGIDTNPTTAIVTGITGWNPSMNETATDIVAVEATTNMYGRFYKKHRFADDFQSVPYYAKLAEEFSNNAADTMENLAVMRLYEGAQKLFVKSVSEPSAVAGSPIQPRLTLGANASEVTAQLTWDALLEVKYAMQNHQASYCTVDPSTGALKKDNKRVEPIGGWRGSPNYLVLVSPAGFDQLTNDPEFLKLYVIGNGPFATLKAQNQTCFSLYGLDIKQVGQGLFTISKEASPKLITDGTGALDVAFVLGGGNARIGIELDYAGWTGMINVGYEEDKKVDPFSLLSIVGWYSIRDFTVIRNEGVYAIPHARHTYTESGSIIKPTNPNWK